jgi:hypothetical protein
LPLFCLLDSAVLLIGNMDISSCLYFSPSFWTLPAFFLLIQ